MDLNRREFHQLTLAALGGAVSGSLAGCGGEPPKVDPAAPPAGQPAVAAAGEPHLCRGLNACRNQGASGKNDCAGQGDCASKEWRHSCSTQNACKGRGGCGENPGENACKEKGGCSVPLMTPAWDKVRARFEEKMKQEGKTIGQAPPAKE